MAQKYDDIKDDAALIWACAEPIIKSMRAKPFGVKSEVYGGLTRVQRALLMFQVVRGHLGSGIEELFSGLSYLLVKEEVWREMSKAFLLFGDDSMAELITDMQQSYNELKSGGIRTQTQAENIRSLDERLKTLLPEAEKLTAAYIRSHPEEF
jgi:hypothetical protein